MARQTTRRSQTIALLVLLACLIGSGVAVWGLGAQDRISSDRYDIRTPALESAPDTLQGHILWTIEALNGREVSNEEITSRLSTEMLLSVSPSQVQRDFAEVRARGPFEYRGYEIDAEGVLAAGLRAPSGEVLQIAALQSEDLARLRMLRLDVGESRRGPFTSVEAVVHLVAAWGLLLSGAATWVLRFRPRTGQLLLGAGTVWLAQFLELTNSAGLYTVGLVAGPLGAALVAVALLSFGGRFGQLEWVASGVAMAAAVAAVAQLFAIDTSVANLPRQFLGITHDRATAQNLATLGQIAAIIAVVVLAAVLLWRQRSRDGLGAHERSAVAAAGLVIAGLVAATAAWGLTGEHHDLSQSPWVSPILVSSRLDLDSRLRWRRRLVTRACNWRSGRTSAMGTSAPLVDQYSCRHLLPRRSALWAKSLTGLPQCCTTRRFWGSQSECRPPLVRFVSQSRTSSGTQSRRPSPQKMLGVRSSATCTTVRSSACLVCNLHSRWSSNGLRPRASR